jgi:glycosyltransferase involved in cell wall biosynthesis
MFQFMNIQEKIMNHKITIITPSYNQADFIEKTIQSVINQNYPNFEHIVMDGGSTDGTVEILKKYPHLIWKSERDKGQADALNKGIKYATGEIIGWINSDDYYEENIFNTINDRFQNENTNWLVGNLNVVDLNTNEITPIKSPKITLKGLTQNPDIVKQPCTFFRKNILEKVGYWNENFYMVMDYDLWIRIAQITEPEMIDQTFANFVIHPNQKTNLKNSLTQINEIKKILSKDKELSKYLNSILYRKYKSYFKKRLKKVIGK